MCIGVCYHGLGYHDKAAEDYRQAFSIPIGSVRGDEHNLRKITEVATLQFLAWYQRELALYIKSVLDYPVHAYSLDQYLPAEFKVMT